MGFYQTFNPVLTVEIVDGFGELVNTSSAAVTLTLGPGAGAAGLNGTTTVNAVKGVATFPDVSVNLAGHLHLSRGQ